MTDVREVSIDKLQLDPDNARLHDERGIEAIGRSLTRFGQFKPIVVDRDGIVRMGNGVLLAARELGWSTVKVIETDLTEKELTAAAIADNKTHDLSRFDFEVLSEVVRGLSDDGVDIHDLGFADFEIDSLLSASWALPSDADEETDADADEESSVDEAGEEKDDGVPVDAISVVLVGEHADLLRRVVERLRKDGLADGSHSAVVYVLQSWIGD